MRTRVSLLDIPCTHDVRVYNRSHMSIPFIPHRLPLENLDWMRFVHLLGKAGGEVARFDGLLKSLPNPSVLLSPMEMNEAVLSSRIEGTKATLDEVYRFEASAKELEEKRDDIQEVLNYRKAMRFAVREMRTAPLSNRLIKATHAILLDGVRGKHKDPGNFRSGQVQVGDYIPPGAQNVIEHMSDLEKYFHTEEKDVLVQLAIVHAQFEIIHPFWDGNGRTGRILMPLFLYHKKILSSPMFYLSAYFEEHRSEYYDRLSAISHSDDWAGWVTYFLQAVIDQSQRNIEKAEAILALYNQKKERIVDLTHSQFAIKTLDFLFSNPYFTGAQFAKESKIPKASAARILTVLTTGNVVKQMSLGSGPRPTLYAFPKLLVIIR